MPLDPAVSASGARPRNGRKRGRLIGACIATAGSVLLIGLSSVQTPMGTRPQAASLKDRLSPVEYSRLMGSGKGVTQLVRSESPPNIEAEEESVGLTDPDSNRFTVYSKGYPLLNSIAFYPWQYIVEPFRATVLKVPSGLLEDGRQYQWSIRLAGGGEELLSESNRVGEKIAFTFTSPLETYEVTVTATVANNAEAAPIVVTALLKVKYVRREIRSLSTADRVAYFAALGVVASMGIEEGQEKYGTKFKNLQYMMVKHIHNQDCSPFHNGNGFFTSHAAFTLELDQALQAITPSTLQPYWDYTIDERTYGNTWYLDSPIFQHDWYGAATPVTPDRRVSTSWTDGVPVPTGWNKPVRNSYGLITNTVNNNPAQYVSRAHEFCGLENRIPLPTCMEMEGCLSKRTMGDLRECVEGQLHRDLHMGIGGSWECRVDLGAVVASDPSLEPLLSKLSIQTLTLHNSLWRAGYLICPFACGETTPFEECRCTCPVLESCGLGDAANAVTWQQAYDVFDQVGVVNSLRKFLRAKGAGTETDGTSPDPRADETINSEPVQPAPPASAAPKTCALATEPLTSSRRLNSATNGDTPPKNTNDANPSSNPSAGKERRQFEGVDDATSESLWLTLLDLGCHPGKLGQMATGSSSGDPLFWPIHPYFDRLWAYMRLNKNGEFDDMDWGWGEEGEKCYGHNSYDSMPFSGLFGEPAGEHYYSNAELVTLFDPRNPDLPYVYDNFRWDHCQASEAPGGQEL